jgi:hypothetical protein
VWVVLVFSFGFILSVFGLGDSVLRMNFRPPPDRKPAADETEAAAYSVMV